MQILEDRLTPANDHWAPPAWVSNPQFGTLANWRTGSGPSNFATELPNGDDHLYFTGDLSSAACTIPSQPPPTGENAFAGIHLKFGLVANPVKPSGRVP